MKDPPHGHSNLLISRDILGNSVISCLELKSDEGNGREERQYRLFNGMINDVRRRFAFYKSDFTDALTFKTLTTIAFVFLASITPAVTFGGLMGQYTDEAMGMTETLMAQCICGIIFALFAAQPLIIVSATGPVLIFEHSLYTICQMNDMDFLSIRVYAGFWIFGIVIFVVAFDGAKLLVYVTRFTEDIFAVLISIIFFAESLKFLKKTFEANPVLSYENFLESQQNCQNRTFLMRHPSYQCALGQPNTALLSFLAFFMTFAIACTFKVIRESNWFGRHCRNFFGDFGVAVAIFLVSAVVHVVFGYELLQRLQMPETLSFTNSDARGHQWLVIPTFSTMESRKEASRLSLAAALLVFVLIFAETEVTELLLVQKDRKMTKGGGMHWDLLLMGFCALLCSITGLPWMCAAAVQSLAHCGALTISERQSPGGKLVPTRVIEQRVTTLAVAILTGIFARLGKHLHLPIASLFGVFMYLGVMNLINVQLIERASLFLRPVKYYPEASYVGKLLPRNQTTDSNVYCQLSKPNEELKKKLSDPTDRKGVILFSANPKVSVWRIHLFTIIQILLLCAIYAVKQFKQSAVAFPFVLMLFVAFRQIVIAKIFTKQELEALDGEEHKEDDSEKHGLDFYGTAPIPV